MDFVDHTIERSKLYKSGVLLAVWDIADTDRAFYQAIDYQMLKGGRGTKNDTDPHASIPAIVPNECYNSWVLYQLNYARSLCDCHAFYQLVGNEGVLLYCSPGLVFNQGINNCDWPYNVDTSDIPCSREVRTIYYR